MNYPPWVIIHLPHDSLEIPLEVRRQFILSDDELSAEKARMADLYTLEIFNDKSRPATIIRSPVSRLVVDVERFEDDAQEPMAKRGMGAVYTVTSEMKPLRYPLSPREREALMTAYYRPHHAKLEEAVSATIHRHGHCLVLDCHSFHSKPLPYELADQSLDRPDICIGTDEFHTSTKLSRIFVDAFLSEGWSVAVNDPFSGALVPYSRHLRDSRVMSIMVEVSRRLYLSETDSTKLPEFDDIACRIRRCCIKAIDAFRS